MKNDPRSAAHQVAAAAPDTYAMDDAPRDGSMIEVHSPDGNVRAAIWRITRRRNHEARRWERVEYWSTPWPPFEEVPTEGARWRLQAGFSRREDIDGAA